MESPRYGMLSASPRRPHTYAKQAAHGRAGWHSNFPPFEQPERAHKVAQERVVEGRPWLASRGASSSPRAGGSPRSSPRPHRGTLDNVPLHQIPVQPVATGRFANAAAKNVPQMALDRRWQENLSAAAAARPGKKKETVSRMFEIIDKDRTGTLTHEEVFKSILSLQLKVKPGEIDQLVRSCDTNGDGVIDYDEFRIGIMKLQQSDGMGFHGRDFANRPKQAMVLKHELGECTGKAATNEELDRYMQSLKDSVETKYGLLRKAFMAIDKDRTNFLTKSEIVDVVQSFALPIPVSHIHQVFEEILDINQDGKISYAEFCEKLKPYEVPEGA